MVLAEELGRNPHVNSALAAFEARRAASGGRRLHRPKVRRFRRSDTCCHTYKCWRSKNVRTKIRSGRGGRPRHRPLFGNARPRMRVPPGGGGSTSVRILAAHDMSGDGVYEQDFDHVRCALAATDVLNARYGRTVMSLGEGNPPRAAMSAPRSSLTPVSCQLGLLVTR